MLTGLTRSLNALLPSMPIARGSSVAQATPARWTRRVPTGNFFRSAHPSIGIEEFEPPADRVVPIVFQFAKRPFGKGHRKHFGPVGSQKCQDRRCVGEPLRRIYPFERRWERADRSSVQQRYGSFRSASVGTSQSA